MPNEANHTKVAHCTFPGTAKTYAYYAPASIQPKDLAIVHGARGFTIVEVQSVTERSAWVQTFPMKHIHQTVNKEAYEMLP